MNDSKIENVTDKSHCIGICPRNKNETKYTIWIMF